MEKEKVINTVDNTETNVIKTRLYDLTYDELIKTFHQVRCHLVRREVVNNKTRSNYGYKEYNYYAVVEFKKGVFELKIRLTMDEYNILYMSRNKNAAAIGDSFSTNILYLAIKSTRKNEKTEKTFDSIQVKLVFSDRIRKNLWLSPMQVESVNLFKAMELLDRPELIEEDAEEVQESFGF